jgi:hypothetical protein
MQKARLAVHHRSACSGVKALRNRSDARRQAAKLCYRFGPLTPFARSVNLIAGDGTWRNCRTSAADQAQPVSSAVSNATQSLRPEAEHERGSFYAPACSPASFRRAKSTKVEVSFATVVVRETAVSNP